MTLISPIFLSMIFFSPQKVKSQTVTNYFFYVGTYTNDESEGIYKYWLKEDGSIKKIGLVAKSNNPSYLAKSLDNAFLIAVNEIGNNAGGGKLESYAIEADSLKRISQKSSGGGYPCFIGINKKGYVLTANYEDGTVTLSKLTRTGALSEPLDVLQHVGSGTTPRQEGPHAHSVWFDGNDNIISIDLGTNDLWFSRIETNTNKITPSNPQTLPMPIGAGPRHMTLHPNNTWAYVINELSSTITMLSKSNTENYKIGQSISTLPNNYDGTSTCADIHISSDGKFVYASNRGHDSIAIYSVNSTNGELDLVGHELTRGKTPRNFALSPDDCYLLVANQNTNTIVSFKRDETSGLLTFVDEIDAPTPVCILF